jgi:allantoin racemase
MIKIKVIYAGPKNQGQEFRKLNDLLRFQDLGVEITFGYNTVGPIHCQTSIEEALARAGMAQQAAIAEQEGMDAIVIESMGDTGLIECREAVSIPVVGMSDISFRIASMLGRKFGLVTVGSWHGYAVERLIKSYGAHSQYVGFQPIHMQPFFTDARSDEEVNARIATAMIKLIKLDADTVVFGGSYFLGKTKKMIKILTDKGYEQIVLIDPLSLAIRAARMLVDADLVHSKKIYANPHQDTPVIGYPSIPSLPGIIRSPETSRPRPNSFEMEA